MSRPKKNNADYFPHDNTMWSDRKIVAIRNRFGLVGYALWNLLLETLCESANFEIRFDEVEMELLADFWGIEKEKLEEIFEYFKRLNLIKIEGGVLWSEKFKERLEPVLNERDRKRMWARKRWEKAGNSEEVDVENDLQKVLDVDNPSNSGKSMETSMRSKEKESKVNKSKEEKKKGKEIKEKIVKKENTPKKIFGGDSFEFQVCKKFLERNIDRAQIRFLIEKNGKEQILEEWADEVRKLKEVDGYTEDQITYVFDYTPDHQFWKEQIFSVKKFRQKNRMGVPYFVVIIDEIYKDSRSPVIADLST